MYHTYLYIELYDRTINCHYIITISHYTRSWMIRRSRLKIAGMPCWFWFHLSEFGYIQMFPSLKNSMKQGLGVYKKVFSFSFVICFTIGKNLGKSIQCGTWPLSFCTQSTLNFLCWGGKKSTETYSKERLGVFVVFEGGTIKN